VGVRFPWGSVLALHCGSESAPLDVASGGQSPACAIDAFVLGAVTATPAIRVARGGEGRRSYSLSSASADRDPAHRSTDAFSASRMRTLRGLSGALKSLHRVASTSDVPVVTRRHTRVGILTARCAGRHHASLARDMSGVDLRVRGPLRRPAGESKTGMSPRTPSIVS
jgi:hypothetical protein